MDSDDNTSDFDYDLSYESDEETLQNVIEPSNNFDSTPEISRNQVWKFMSDINAYVSSVVKIPLATVQALLNYFRWINEPNKNVNSGFEILTTDQVVKLMNQIITDVSSVVQISSAGTIRALLNNFKWSPDVLMDRLYGDHQEKLFEEMKISNPFNNNFSCVVEETHKKSGECRVCCDIFPNSKLIGLQCGHRFCSACWKSYLNEKIMDLGMDTIACLEHECNVLLEQEQCLRILQDSRVRQVYKRLITNNFVESNRLMTWCPNPNCDKAVKVEFGVMQSITCSCNVTFCFKCGEDWHSPLKCSLFKKWLQQCESDLETTAWLKTNSKDCPRCRSPIEKDGGCNHMECRNKSCGHKFCWVCLRPTPTTNFPNCKCESGQFDNRVSSIRDKEEALRKFSPAYFQYMSQKQSLQLEEKLGDSVEAKVMQLKRSGVTAANSEVLKKAIVVLRQCRTTLMFSYPFTFYLKKESHHTLIFKNNRADLQSATENLSACLEREMDRCRFNAFLDLYRYCEDRRRVLEQHIEEGYENLQWEFKTHV